MELLNNRYRVLKDLESDGAVSSYIVYDTVKYKETQILNILDQDIVNDELIKYYSDNFIRFISIDNRNIVRNYELGMIFMKDGLNAKDKKYYFTSGYMENKFDIEYIVKSSGEDEIMDIFLQVCRAVNYLHIKDYVYGGINLNNLFIDYNGRNPEVRLRDLASVNLYRFAPDKLHNIEKCFIKPEMYINSSYLDNKASDIYSLGILLFIFSIKDVEKALDIILNNNITSFLNDTEGYHNAFYLKLRPIIMKILYDGGYERIEAGEIIKDINKVFGFNYSAINIEELDKVSSNSRIVDRDQFLDEMFRQLKAVESDGISRLVHIYGDTGIGKSRFLSELKHYFALRDVRVYFSNSLMYHDKKSSSALKEILGQIISKCENGIWELYEPELVKIMPEIMEEKNILPTAAPPKEKERSWLIDRTANFIRDSYSGTSVIIVDNIDYSEDFFIDIFKYIMSNNIKNILIVTTTSETNNVFRNLKSNQYLEEIRLQNISRDDTERLCRSLLGESENINSLIWNKIYEKTRGNPLFIKKMLEYLHEKKYIYISEESGVWKAADILNWSELPSDLDEVINGLTEKLDEDENELLKMLSVINSEVSYKFIEEFAGFSGAREDTLKHLVKSGMLNVRGGGDKSKYSFGSEMIKEIFFHSLEPAELKRYSIMAGDALIRLDKSKYTYAEDIIYYYNKAGETNKIVEYCNEASLLMEARKLTNKAAEIMETAYRASENMNDQNIKAGIAMRLINLYYITQDWTRITELLRKNDLIYDEQVDEKLRINMLNKLSAAYRKIGMNEESLENINRISEMLRDKLYIEAYVENQLNRAYILINDNKIDQAYDLCNDAVKECPDIYPRIKGKLFNVIGLIHIFHSQPEKALSALRKAECCFKDSEDIKDLIVVINNIATIYSDFYQNDEEALKCNNEIWKISVENRMIDMEVLTLCNIGQIQIKHFKYKDALESLKKLERKLKAVESKQTIDFYYRLLLDANLKTYDFASAYSCYQELDKTLGKVMDYGLNTKSHYVMLARMFYEFGDLEIARQYIEGALKLCSGESFSARYECDALDNFIRLQETPEGEDISRYIENISQIIKGLSNKDIALNMLCNMIIAFYPRLEEVQRSSIKKDIDSLMGNSDLASVLQVRLLFIKAIDSDNKDKVSRLSAALKMAKAEGEEELIYLIYLELGKYYLEKKNWVYAANYYIEAVDQLRDFVIRLPEQFKLKFFEKRFRPEVFINITQLAAHYNKNKKTPVYNYCDSSEIQQVYDIMMDYKYFRELIDNRYFMSALKKTWYKKSEADKESIEKILKAIKPDPIENLQNIVKYLEGATLASGIAIIHTEDNKPSVLVSSGTNAELSIVGNIIKKTQGNNMPFIISKMKNVDLQSEKLLPFGAKTIMCIPVKSDEKVKSTDTYIYLQWDNLLGCIESEVTGCCLRLNGYINFITEEYKLKASSTYDKLTGAVDRKYLEDMINENIKLCQKGNRCFSLVMIDLDNFKNINDRFGHQTGDKVLKEICSVIKSNIRNDDILGRYGGEEFIVLLRSAGAEQALKIAEKLRISIESQNILGNRFPITASMGISSYPAHGQWKNELIERADQALYISKNTGKNRCTLWNRQLKNKNMGTDKLAGIITGNTIKDYRSVLTMVDLLDIVKQEEALEDKIYKYLGRVIETIEAHLGMLFCVRDGKVTQYFARRLYSEKWAEYGIFNSRIVEEVIESGKGVNIIDWDNITDYDPLTGMPFWDSVIAVPIIDSSKVYGVIYVSSPMKEKEFSPEEYNFMNVLGELSMPILKEDSPRDLEKS